MDRAAELIDKWGDKLAEIAARVGPEVADLAMTAIAVQHIGAIVMGFFMVLLGGAMIVFANTTRKVAGKHYRGEIGNHRYASEKADAASVRYALATVSFVVGFTIFCIGLFDHVLDVWNWAAVYDPRLIVAKKVLGL